MKRLLVLLALAALALPLAYAQARGASSARKTAICHRVSSAKKPYVKLMVNAAALRTHGRHGADIIPAPSGGCPRTVLTASRGGTAISTVLTGEVESPAGDPVATGTATLRLRRGQGQACVTIKADELPSAALAAHVHEAPAGSIGGIVVPLPTPNASGAAAGCVPASRAIVARILANPAGFYVNVHTKEFPGGAVRGQLSGTSAASLGRTFAVALTGTVERPSGDPDGTGRAVVRIRRDDGMLCFRLTVQNILLPSAGAHIHRAPAGSAGPIVTQLTAPGDTGVSTGCVAVDKALLDEILASPAGFYANVHTREFPAGAVRGQLG